MRWLRWAAFVPIAVAFFGTIWHFYPPVGEFLGGYFWPWTYKLALLLFAFVATFGAVILAIAIAPNLHKAVGVLAGAGFVGLDCLYIHPVWPLWYTAVYLLLVIAAAALAYLIAVGFVDIVSTPQDS